MPPERRALQLAETRPWFERARQDLTAATRLLEAQEALTGTVVFHCQQAGEKSLKGFLSWHERPFAKTHDLARLGLECVALDPSLEPLCRRAESLTDFAWRFRYPGEPEDPSREEAEETLALAREVYEAILSRLPDEVRPSAPADERSDREEESGK